MPTFPSHNLSSEREAPVKITDPADRRGLMRRADDRAIDDLQSTFSTMRCRGCLERMADAALLLDSETQVIYSTPSVDRLVRDGAPFSLTPKFTPRDPQHAQRFATFRSEKHKDDGPLSLLLERKDERGPLLLTSLRLPEPATPDIHAARYLILLRDPGHFPQQQWRLFTQQFRLTQAESRLCRALADGLTVQDYSRQWHVAASTARSQLNSVFAKTSTRRQADLLRLIFLFTRA
jgi:DNA-binding CsgD family transcriptional regulator